MFCPKCGAKQDDDSRFCHNCGENLSEFLDLDDIADMTEESEQAQHLSFQQETAVDTDGLASDAGESKSSNAVKAQIYQNNAPTENYVKPKKKRAIKGIAAVAVIILIAAGAVFAVRNFAGNTSGGDKYVFLRDGRYYLTSNLEKDKEIEIGSVKGDYSSEELVKFSPDGKFVYYYTKVEEGNGTLCRAQIEKLKKDSSKNDKYIEIIASSVNVYSELSFMKDGHLIYKNSEDSLYCFDGKESTRIGKNVSTFYTDEDSKIIYTVENKEYDYEGDETYTYDLYGVDINNIDSNIKMAKNYSRILNDDDFNNIYFIKDEYGEKPSLYVAGFDKEETIKICGNVKGYWVVNGEVFYLERGDYKLKLADYVIDNGGNSMYFEDLRYALQNEEPEYAGNFCTYKEGKEIIIAEKVVDADVGYGAIAYLTADMITDKFSLNNLESESELRSIFHIEYDCTKAVYLRTSKLDEKIQMSDNAASKLSKSEWYDLHFYEIGSRMYIGSQGEIFEAKIEGNQIADVISKGEGFPFAADDNSLYLAAPQNMDDEYSLSDLSIITDGELRNLVKGVIVSFDYSGGWYDVGLYEDGIVIAFTDFNYEERYGDLVMVDTRGENIKVGTDISQYIRKGKNEILFISDDSLFLFNGKEKRKLKNDVTRVWSYNCEKLKDMKTDEVSYGYY